jgi:hypothetical protein
MRVGQRGGANQSTGSHLAGHTQRMRLVVWVDDWQMQCCGEPFHVGSEVAWTVSETGQTAQDRLESMLGANEHVKVDAAEEHHGGLPPDTPRTRGTVARIRACHCRYEPSPGEDPRVLYPVPGSGVVSDLESADGWTPDRGGAKFVGYLVDLDSDGPAAQPT